MIELRETRGHLTCVPEKVPLEACDADILPAIFQKPGSGELHKDFPQRGQANGGG